MLEKFTVKTIDVKKYEHLKEGVSPIMACVGTIESFEEDKKMTELLLEKQVAGVQNINFESKIEELKKMELGNDGRNSYVISQINNLDKYSKKFYDCTGLVVAGIEKGTNQKISFMSHQNPEYFLNNKNEKLSEALRKKIQTIKDRCEDGTVDVVIFGGRYAKVREFRKSDPDRDIFIKEYLESIKYLSKIVKEKLGFEPLVITGPKTFPGGDYAFYDTEKGKLHLARTKTNKNDITNPETDEFNAAQSFTPDEIDERSKKWKPGEWTMPI